MNRRAYLAGLLVTVSGLSGCLSQGGIGGPSLVSAAIVERRGSQSPLSLSVSTLRGTTTPEKPAQIQFTIQNTGEKEASYLTGEPTPFGILTAGDHVLWTDAYRKSNCIQTEGREIKGGCDGGPSVTLQPGQRQSETYEFSAPPGEYMVEDGTLEIGTMTYAVEITVQ